MADSDISRTLLAVTRRSVLSTTAALLTLQFGASGNAIGAQGTAAADHRVLDLWRRWLAAHEETERFCKMQQRLESRMVAAVGFPLVKIALPGGEGPVCATRPEDIDRICGDAAEHQTVKVQAIETLRERQQAWDRLDEDFGYSRAQETELRSDRLERKLAKALWAEPVHSIAGVAAKLHAMLVMGEPQNPSHEFPWPELRAVLDDLARNIGHQDFPFYRHLYDAAL